MESGNAVIEVPSQDSGECVIVATATAPTPAAAGAGSNANTDACAKRSGGSRKPYNTKRKRQRAFLDALTSSPTFEDRPLLVDRCRREICDLCAFFRESLVPDLRDGAAAVGEAAIACAMEGSALPLPVLAEEMVRSGVGMGLQSLLTELPFVGSRIRYGVDGGGAGGEAGQEDEESNCLWCWEAREVSLFPKSHRGFVKFLRATRKKVHARISALSVTMVAISNSKNAEDYKAVLLKASERLKQEPGLDDLRISVEKFLQKQSTDAASKETNVNGGFVEVNAEKLDDKDQQIRKENVQHEKELKRLKDEADKAARKQEKEDIELKKQLKRQQDEALKEERKREKEEIDLKKRLKREQDEADREQKRREKEKAESRKQISLKKQATIMEKFLKRKIDIVSVSQCADSPLKLPVSQSVQENVDVVQSVTSSMDSVLSHQAMHFTKDLLKLHLDAWRNLCQFNKSRRWGLRSKPRPEVAKKNRLQGPLPASWSSQKAEVSNKDQPCNHEKVDCPTSIKESDDLEEIIYVLEGPEEVDFVKHNDQKLGRIMKLLQFDKSPRPAYYGTWSKKSTAVGPRHPLRKDSDLDYEVESDEEWEEEEPGESLTDCEKDEDECDDAKAESKDESEDSFVVPDGYLSENEGAEMDIATSDAMKDDATSLSSCQPDAESEEFRLRLQHVKYLNNLTEKALSKSQPLIISNLMHEKSDIRTESLQGVMKIEHTCLQALSMQIYPGGSVIDFCVDNRQNMEEEMCQSQCKADASPVVLASLIPESDLPEIVRTIRSCPQSIGKVVEVLQQKFPTLSKTQIKNKVREVAEFTDNRWKVKKQVMNSLGLTPSPDRPRKTKGISTFFSKRCLPPTGDDVCAADSSPLQKKIRTAADTTDAEGPTTV